MCLMNAYIVAEMMIVCVVTGTRRFGLACRHESVGSTTVTVATRRSYEMAAPTGVLAYIRTHRPIYTYTYVHFSSSHV